VTALPETQRQRHVRLHRLILAAGRLPSKTLAGCELQARMLASGELAPLPEKSAQEQKAVERAMAGDRERHLQRDADAGRVALDEHLRYVEDTTRWDDARRATAQPGNGPLAGSSALPEGFFVLATEES
jgi:hypothetical protein